MRPGTRTVDAVFWRLLPDLPGIDPLSAAPSPEGRFHRGADRVLYLSESPEGCLVATRRYRRPDDPGRRLHGLHVMGQVADFRDRQGAAALGLDLTHREIEWQDWRARGEDPPTWALTDAVRALGLDGMLYRSRSDPDLTHLTILRWNGHGTARVAWREDRPALR